MSDNQLATGFCSVKTRENTVVHLHRDLIGAIEEIPATLRSQAYLKVYVSGYHFTLDMSFDDFQKLLHCN